MSESKQKQLEATRLAETLIPAVSRVSAAIRKYAIATSGHLGSDCHAHAELGHHLLKELGFESEVVFGFAAWRIGPGTDDVVGHVPLLRAYLPTGGIGAVYHAWIQCQMFVIDFTTYQLRHKAQLLDAADGCSTTVTWCPDYLCIQPNELARYEELAFARRAGVSFYKAMPELDALLRSQPPVHPAHLLAVRLLLANPDANVIGPNDLGA